MRYLAVIAILLAVAASDVRAQGYNPSQVGQALVTDCTVVLASTGTPQQVLAQSGTPGAAQGTRIKLILQNLSAGTIGFSFTLTSTLALSSSQQFVLASQGSWTSDADMVPMNSVWAVGQTNAVLACNRGG